MAPLPDVVREPASFSVPSVPLAGEAAVIVIVPPLVVMLLHTPGEFLVLQPCYQPLALSTTGCMMT